MTELEKYKLAAEKLRFLIRCWLFCLGIGSLCDLVASPWIKRKPTPPVDPKYDPYWATGGKKPK